MSTWYSEYTVTEPAKFLNDIEAVMNTLLEENSNYNQAGRRTSMSEIKQWYKSDPGLQRLDLEHKKVTNNSRTETNYHIMRNLEKQCQKVTYAAEEKYWLDLVSNLNTQTTASIVSKKSK